jgi:hypothetical protein
MNVDTTMSANLTITAESLKDPHIWAQLLALISARTQAEPDEWRRYVMAEQLAMASYPTFKFSEYGRIFLDDEAFLEYYKKYMDPGNWHSLDRKYAVRELMKTVSATPGDFVECGVYAGATAELMCLQARDEGRKVHLYDSFQGLSEPGPLDGDYWTANGLRCARETVEANLAPFNNTVFHEGWIPDTFDASAPGQVAALHIDVDLHQPTYDTLAFFYPRLSPGALVIMDDYGFRSCPGARKAADDFMADKPERIALLPTGQAIFFRGHPDRA